MFPFKKKSSEIIKEENYRLSFREFLHLYWNKKNSYFLDDFLSGDIQKRNKHLKFRKNGDVDWDIKSRKPSFVEYNNTRLEIKEWMRTTKQPDKGYYEFTGNFSGALWEAFKEDGFRVYLMKEVNEMGHKHKIPLVSNNPWSF